MSRFFLNYSKTLVFKLVFWHCDLDLSTKALLSNYQRSCKYTFVTSLLNFHFTCMQNYNEGVSDTVGKYNLLGSRIQVVLTLDCGVINCVISGMQSIHLITKILHKIHQISLKPKWVLVPVCWLIGTFNRTYIKV